MSKRAVVLGAYGLIGSSCVRALLADGFDVTAVGRSRRAADRSGLAVAGSGNLNWVFCDIARAGTGDWAKIFRGADVVVNASGALQDGARDRLGQIHDTALQAMVAACDGQKLRFVQISAAGVGPDASTEFLKSKWHGEEHLRRSTLDWVILRPVLVIGREAYGGTALLRAVAALPWIGPRVLGEVQVQTVALDDVAAAVAASARGEIPGGTEADLTEADSRSFAETLAALRAWLGYRPWRSTFGVPGWAMVPVVAVSDVLGWLGWRPPLRTSAVRSLENGITGDPAPWLAAGGQPCRALDRTLAGMPATAQERVFARAYLLCPLAIATLSAFWIATGLVAILSQDVAASILIRREVGEGLALGAVWAGAVTDIVLGMAVLVRSLVRPALLGMIALSAGYLLLATLLAPDLWRSPLGALVKVLPIIGLTLVPLGLLDER